MAEPLVVEVQSDVAQGVAAPPPDPGLVREQQVLSGIGLDPVIGVYVTHNGGSFILEHLAAYGVVPVVVAVEEELDGGLADAADLLQHGLGVLHLHGVYHHHPLLSHDEQGDDEPRGGEAEHPRSNLLTVRLGSLETRV